jgi:3-hydroxyacyl-[acyl-carrier-protein] dehydratase
MSVDIEIMDTHEIMQALPHRYPFLLIDKVLGGTVGECITAKKVLADGDPFFEGHFPGRPIMPGVLVIEAMAQAGGVLSYLSMIDIEPKPLFFLAGIDNARFRRPVLPGEELLIQVDVERVKGGIWFYKCEATVGGKSAVSANIVCAPGGER